MKKLNLKKDVIFTNDTDIRLGFEVECRIRDEDYTKFCREIYNLKKRTNIGYDGSISGCGFEYRAVELRTSPLPPKRSMETLRAIFVIVNKYGNTNTSCGLHVNISSANKSKMKNFDPFPFIYSKLWEQILRKFKRKNNRYCKTIFGMTQKNEPAKICLFKSMTSVLNNKFKCVNFLHFGNGMNKTSRIEIRGFGNKNYTKKFEVISIFVKRIEKLFNLSCSSRLHFVKALNV
jgi:hypothetical protein